MPTKQQQRQELLDRVSAYDSCVDRGVPIGDGRNVIVCGLNSLEPKFAYSPIFWIRSAYISYARGIRIEELAQWTDRELLSLPNVHKKTLRWIRENYPADYVASQ